MGDDGKEPLDYAGPRTPRNASIEPPLEAPMPVARKAWAPGDEGKALAEGCLSMLVVTLVMPVVAFAIVFVAFLVLAGSFVLTFQ